MTAAREDLRVRGTIVSVVQEFDHDHAAERVFIHLKLEQGEQSFGGLFDSKGDALLFLLEAAQALGYDGQEVREAERYLVGKPCIALYEVERWYREDIVGIEASDGRRFTKRGFFLRRGKQVETPTERHSRRILADIQWALGRAAESSKRLAELGHVIDWETEP